MPLSVDLLVVGGGFGGSTLALVARRLGLSVLVAERGRHPRFAIGESSTPAGNMILAALGRRYDLPVLTSMARYGSWKEDLPAVGVGPKRGFSYIGHEVGRPWSHEQGRQMLVAASNSPVDCDTHWYRPEVDQMLFAHAGDAGAETCEGTEVVGYSEGVATLSDGRTVKAAALVDATGSSRFARTRLAVKPGPPLQTQTSACFAHVRNLPTWQMAVAPDPADYPFPIDAAAQHHVSRLGWMWQLRFDNQVTSVGMVCNGPVAPDRAVWFAAHPSLAGQFDGTAAAWVEATTLQRIQSRAGGPGWALLPSAAGFVDPLHSMSIAHTLSGIERLACLLERGATDFSAYGEQTIMELRHMDRLAAVCYQAMGAFPSVTAATMPYFVCSIAYERGRLAGGRPGYLCFDDPALASLAETALERAGDPDLDVWMRRAIAPFNDVGLLDPDLGGMYRHTAPRAW